MANFIDRRLNSKNKSTVNRQRFLRRYKNQIKKSVADAINKRGVTDINSGENIIIPKKDYLSLFFTKAVAALVTKFIRVTTNLPPVTV